MGLDERLMLLLLLLLLLLEFDDELDDELMLESGTTSELEPDEAVELPDGRAEFDALLELAAADGFNRLNEDAALSASGCRAPLRVTRDDIIR